MKKKNEDGGKDRLHLLQQFVTSNEAYLTHKLITVFEEHLTYFSDFFQKFFPDDMD